jgi:hypothetical protein
VSQHSATSSGSSSGIVVVVGVLAAGAVIAVAVWAGVSHREKWLRGAVARYAQLDSTDAVPDTVGIVDNTSFEHPQDALELGDEEEC